ncbi:MAG: LlaJI family restriction endonuclease [Cytophagia bacterium]|nr:MAG: LlaJI family restriction endonuclease [Runella sp.]TAG19259.1 MAG: LlaJI family restriction endonuclease [Cytophagales bacterium]TAG38513.1 MAG: LlaJI family restriction endonuclease [Cytophagia bacterium]TAG80132.1 MAG: LlaJI family restriction endonuclease [Cytophagales bacterium]
MILLFESAKYDTEKLQPLLGERYYRPLVDGQAQIDYVGYYYAAPADHSVLLLPKVFLKNGQTFAGHTPNEWLDLPHNPTLQAHIKQEGKADFMFRFSVWLYQAIKIFRQRHPDSSIAESADLQQITEPQGHKSLSELEIINSLLRFHRGNPALFTFIKRYNNSQRHQVSWNRTVQRQTALLQNGVPMYVETVNKRKNIDSDEELFVLFFSVLRHLNNAYNLKIELNPLYEPLPEREFKKLLAGQGTRRLQQIRGKYYSDKMRQLWQLLYAYFNRAERSKTQKNFREVLLVRDFNIVFEDMIDALLTDPAVPLPKALKEHKDGKILDHVYEYASLIAPEDSIYHIGDSKYYSDATTMGQASVYKQYTYARNVIQLNIDLLNEGKLAAPLRYRDPLTEGYNVTPNFFISALVNDSLDFQADGLAIRPDSLRANRHFTDRLFDRDTLLLQAYNINFLYVLASYATQNRQETTRFREAARRQFRGQLVDYLRREYVFYKIKVTANTLENFVTKHFRLLNGQMYRPAHFEENTLLVAVQKSVHAEWLQRDFSVIGPEVSVENWQIV